MNKYIAIDIGGSAVKYAIVDDSGIVDAAGTSEVCNDDIVVFYNQILNICNDFKSKYDVSGIAISSPGAVDQENLIIGGLSALPCIHNNDWLSRLAKDCELTVTVDNDANCALLAELWIGNAKGLSSASSVVLGTGVGGANAVNGKIFSGAHLYGGEFGYSVTKVDGKYESGSDIFSTNALVLKVAEVADVKNGLEVFELYDKEDALVVKIVEEFYENIALFIYNFQHTFDPEIFLIGGAISERPEIISKIKHYYNIIKVDLEMSDIELNVTTCKFKNQSNLIGATYNHLLKLRD